MEMEREIHISDVRSFKSCRRKWVWSSPLGMNLEPNIPYTPFFTGSAVHYCLQQMYRNHGDSDVLTPSLDAFIQRAKKQMEPVWDAEEAVITEQRALIVGMFQHYLLWRWERRDDPSFYLDQNIEFVSLEHSFNVSLPLCRHYAARLAGRFDGIVKDKMGKYWVWENKTARSIKELQRSLANDEQCGVYVYAASKLFKVPIEGVIYNIMRKKLPVTPRILKNGELSKAQEQDTSYEWYKYCIEQTYPGMEALERDSIFGAYLADLKNNPDKQFFLRMPVKRSPEAIGILITEVSMTAREMLGTRTKTYPSPSMINCNWCQFRDPCIAYSRGQHEEAAQVLKDNYRQRTSYAEEQEEINNEENYNRPHTTEVANLR